MTQAVVMAGGRGLRLHPLTARLPKPLLKVGDQPLLERIVHQLKAACLTDITFTVCYMADKIADYFGDGSRFGVRISYRHETEAMGTVGGLMGLPADGPIVVVNGDIVADIDFAELTHFHLTGRHDATMAVALYQHQVPFGVVQSTETGTVLDTREKPIENFTVAAGIYVLPSWAPRMIKGPMDMPDLLDKMHVRAWPIRGYWCDIGRFESLAKAHIDWTMKEVK